MRIIPLTFIILFCFNSLNAQSDKPYTDGPIWNLSMIKVKAGFEQIYLKNLAEGWHKVMKQAKQDGLILDYKIISTSAASKDDWNLLLMSQVKNYAMLDGIDDKIEAIQAKIVGSEDTRQKAAFNRNEMRELAGERMGQELIFK